MALELRKQILGEKHVLTYHAGRVLGFDLFDQGNCAAAQPYYEQTVALAKELFGEHHATTAEALNELGKLLQRQGELAAARHCLEQALDIYRGHLQKSVRR